MLPKIGEAIAWEEALARWAKLELPATIRDHYRSSSKKDKSRILDEFIAVTGHHRKHGIRLLGKPDDIVDAGQRMA